MKSTKTNDMGQMVATSEISTELTEIFFLVKHAKQDSTAENCFAPHNEPPTAIVSFSGVVKHFFQKLTKNPSHFSLIEAISERSKELFGTDFPPP